MACSHFVSGSAKPVHWSGEPHAVIILKLDFDASVTILTGASDIGQGSSTIITQVVAEVLGIDYSRIRIIANDSAILYPSAYLGCSARHACSGVSRPITSGGIALAILSPRPYG